MKSHTTKSFRDALDRLPKDVQKSAQKVFKIWKTNHNHPSLKFKRIHSSEPIYSVRISLGWRALGVKEDDTIIWFWIGSHKDYEKILKS